MQKYIEVYIKDRKSGQLVVARAEAVKRTDLTGLRRKGWKFNFLQLFLAKYILYKIVYLDQIEGIIAFINDEDIGAVKIANVESAPHNIGSMSKDYVVGSALFAIACYYSFQCGQEGYVFFEAKTELIEHYKHSLGAKFIRPPIGMGIFPVESKKLIVDYVKEAGKYVD